MPVTMLLLFPEPSKFAMCLAPSRETSGLAPAVAGCIGMAICVPSRKRLLINLASMAKTNGWGLIGTGRIADERILPAINAFSGNTLVAVVSRDAARASAFAKKFRAQRACTRFEDLLENPEVTV